MPFTCMINYAYLTYTLGFARFKPGQSRDFADFGIQLSWYTMLVMHYRHQINHYSFKVTRSQVLNGLWCLINELANTGTAGLQSKLDSLSFQHLPALPGGFRARSYTACTNQTGLSAPWIIAGKSRTGLCARQSLADTENSVNNMQHEGVAITPVDHHYSFQCSDHVNCFTWLNPEGAEELFTPKIN